ncbi:hypothetical protein C8C99_0264 [Acidovorax sp. 107]|nr:hypothetical protein C8C99_0264 [Acidovorax sp. 107]
MSIFLILAWSSPFLIFIFVVLYQIDKFERKFKPPKGRPGLPAWHKEKP